jgi:hypothetical protein
MAHKISVVSDAKGQVNKAINIVSYSLVKNIIDKIKEVMDALKTLACSVPIFFFFACRTSFSCRSFYRFFSYSDTCSKSLSS